MQHFQIDHSDTPDVTFLGVRTFFISLRAHVLRTTHIVERHIGVSVIKKLAKPKVGYFNGAF